MPPTAHRLTLPGFGLKEMIAESIDFLRAHEPAEGYFVGFSGGKDSIVTLELCRMARVRHQAFYSCTRIDPPEMYHFIRTNYPDVTWLYPKMTMWEGIAKKRPPFRNTRWCCDVLKKDPSRNVPLAHRIMGIRAEESVRRASRPRICHVKKQVLYKPIFAWKEWAVWEFIDSQNLPTPALYDEGFGRIGCVVCPIILGMVPGATKQRELSMQRWPGIWKAYEHAVKRWWAMWREKDEYEQKYANETADDYWRSYLLGFEDNPKIVAPSMQGNLLEVMP